MMSMVLGAGVAPVDPEFAAALGIGADDSDGEEGGANKKKGGSGKGKGMK